VKILAVDTALGACSVAILGDNQLLAHRFEVMQRGHAEALAPMVEAAMQDASMNFASLDRLGVTTGPGTFTGQRVGLAFMRALRVALDIPLVGLTTLSVMAHQAMAESGRETGVALHDARRDEVYLEVCGNTASPPRVLSFEDAVATIVKIHGPIVLAGTAAARAKSQLREAVVSSVLQPDALWVAKLCLAAAAPEGPPRPLYLRPPDAKLPERA
jgi:tRNA threonylcarbamoyladenosine biosynthesis protein TsaB